MIITIILIIIIIYLIILIITTRFNDEVSWAFRIFDIDNSGSIAVEEINDSVQVVNWMMMMVMSFMTKATKTSVIGICSDELRELLSAIVICTMILSDSCDTAVASAE